MTSAEYLGPYRVGKQIGQGGMGTVYEGTHATSGEIVAIKLIAKHVADEPRFRRRFASEVETLKRLRHENIVRLIGYGEEKGQLFYSMELVEGEPVQAILQRQKRMPWVRVVDLAIQICSALKHAHDIGVIHRDLKPANLIITKDDQVKLVDFGIAKLFGFGEQTLAGSVLGTADYMAPEQADGTAITVRTDLYALGSSMYAMLAGRPPFSDRNISRVMDALRNERPVSLSFINPEIPEELAELVDHLLQKKATDRPPTALAVNNRLKSMKAGLQREATKIDQGSATLMQQVPATNLTKDAESIPSDSTMHPPPLTDQGEFSSDTDISQSAKAESSQTRGSIHLPSNPHETTSSATAPQISPADLTVESVPGQTLNPLAQTITTEQSTPAEPTSSYQTVEHQSFDELEPSEHSTNWWGKLSIIAMVMVLVGGISLFWQSAKPKTADQIYQTLVDASNNDDLSSVDSSLRLFLKDFPTDDRVSVVTGLRTKLALERLLRQLTRSASRLGGVNKLSPHEQTFVSAMELRSASPVEATNQLQNWLTVFDDTDEPEESPIKQMAQMAHWQISQLEPQLANSGVDSRAEQLMRRIEQSRQSKTKSEHAEMLKSLIELHADAPWASNLIELAREELAEESSP